MSDAIFNSFIKSVYGSGSSMHLFDGHVDGGMEIEGGVEDITVQSIFGASSYKKMNEDEDEDQEEQDEDQEEQDEDKEEQDDKTAEAKVAEADWETHNAFSIDTTHGDEVDEDDDVLDVDERKHLASISILIDEKNECDSITEPISISLQEYNDNETVLNNDSVKEKKGKGSAPQGGLTSHEVASLISSYRD